ncbi:enoyl-CoA hydratase-related protein [Pelovirga terrestris]|uniref:Enoyl-CoA hydratase/isomerase family protein n=1 Tax=Pelovirga terrestris TaxID=2771352 RepID=A0A8J6QJW8_9BACT|nr:enoyl-CoA hydratase-related protein [Pelovirga terrestris]MBD1399469.1 enoyl-CoA hydratase/isomerase family protein [Pelovirga terrestris]
METAGDLVITEKFDALALMTINRPKALNALDQLTLQQLDAAVSAIEADPQIKVAIITGSGEKAFVAGGDIGVMQPLDPLGARRIAVDVQQLLNKIEYGSTVYIAAINGYALGGGCELALACDIRIAADSAQLGQPEVNLGIIPGWGGTQRLPRLVGSSMAKQLMFTGERISAARAAQIGLVSEVVPATGLLARARELAQIIAAKPKMALQLIKEAVNNGREMDMQRAFAYEADLFGLCFATADQKEGMLAFLEKRQPQWRDQ